MSPYVCTFQFWWEELMRAQFHYGNCANWSRLGALFVAVERSFVVRSCDSSGTPHQERVLCHALPARLAQFYNHVVGVDQVGKVKNLFTDLINRILVETSFEASRNLYCVEEMSKDFEISGPMLLSNLPNLKWPWPDPPFNQARRHSSRCCQTNARCSWI